MLATVATSSISKAEQPVLEPNFPDATLVERMGAVVQKKRENLKAVADRRGGFNRDTLEDSVYVISDLGTAGYALLQGISLFKQANSAMNISGSVFGLAGGVLNMAQGLFVLALGFQALKNGRKIQATKQFVAGGSLLLVGLIMTLVSLQNAGVPFGEFSKITSLAESPYAMPLFIFLLVAADSGQIIRHAKRLLNKTHLSHQLRLDDLSQMDDRLKIFARKQMNEKLRELLLEQAQTLVAKLTEEQKKELLKLFELFLDGALEQTLQAQREVCRNAGIEEMEGVSEEPRTAEQISKAIVMELLSADSQVERLRKRLSVLEAEVISRMLEEISEDVGVKGAIEVMDLLQQIGAEKEVETQVKTCRKVIRTWNRFVLLRGIQMSLYLLTFPFGLGSRFIRAGGAKILTAISNFSLTVPASIGGALDACAPFERNGAREVPKVNAVFSDGSLRFI